MKNRTLCFLLALLMAAAMAFGGCASAEALPETEEITVPVIEAMKRFELPDNDALRFVREMKTGWDLGHTFDG